jgi:hypothetical protein
MRGVSAIIVTILLLMISVSLASFGYIFFTRTFSSVADTGSETVEQMTTSMLANMKIDSVTPDDHYVYVRNTGSIDLGQFAVYVNDVVDSGASANPATISPGKIATITLSQDLNDGDVVKVSSDHGAIAILSVPGGSSGTTCSPNGCNGNCPSGCSVSQDPDCGCSNGDGCCGLGCTSSNDNDCAVSCVPNGCNGNCPAGCTVSQDPDCGCSNGNGCCGIGCTSSNDNDCAPVCTPDGCNGNCPSGCSVSQDPDCGCSNGDGCCGLGCTSSNDNDCASGGGLVGFWKFDGNALDSSGNGNDGTNVGGTYVAGHSGQAIDFDGATDYVAVNDDNSLDLTNEMTIAAWIRPRTYGAGGFGRIVDKNYMFYVANYSSLLNALSLYITSTVSSSQNIITLNTWQHVAVTFNVSLSSNQVKFYVNSNPSGSATWTTSIPVSTSSLYIGNSQALNRYFDGSIDEVKVWNRALTAAEIDQEYQSGLPSSLLFSDGFESGDFSAWTAKSENGASISVGTSPVHSGTYSAKTSGLNTNGEYAYSYKSIAGQSTIFARTYFQVSALPAATNSIMLLRFRGTGGVLIFDGRVYNDGGSMKIQGGRWLNGVWAGYTGSPITISVNTWHSLELKAVIGTSGEYVAYYDGVPVATLTGDTTGRGNVNLVDAGGPYLTNSWSVSATVDDIAVSNTYIGP